MSVAKPINTMEHEPVAITTVWVYKTLTAGYNPYTKLRLPTVTKFDGLSSFIGESLKPD